MKEEKYEKKGGKVYHIDLEEDETTDIPAEIAKLEGIKLQYQNSIAALTNEIKRVEDWIKELKKV